MPGAQSLVTEKVESIGEAKKKRRRSINAATLSSIIYIGPIEANTAIIEHRANNPIPNR